jgi:hypothetical protein
VLERTGNDFSSYILQRHRGVVAGLLAASARLLSLSFSSASVALNAGDSVGSPYVTTVVVTADDDNDNSDNDNGNDDSAQQLLCVGSRLTLWRHFLRQGEESVVLDAPLGAVLRDDLSTLSLPLSQQSLRVLVLDAFVVPNNNHTHKQQHQLLVLSAMCEEQQLQCCSGDNSGYSGKSTVRASLWLQTVSVSASTGESALQVLARVRIAEHVTIDCSTHNTGDCDKNSQKKVFNPRLFPTTQSLRVFVVWTNADTQAVECLQIDALGVASLTDQTRQVVRECEAAEALEIGHNVLSVNTVLGLDGVCALTSSK